MKLTSSRIWFLLMFVAFPLAAHGQAVSLEANTDRMGGDYKGFALDQAEPALCQLACSSDAECKAYTYTRPGVKGPQAMCFLKSSVPPSTPDPCCTSGSRTAGGRPPQIIRPQPQAQPRTAPSTPVRSQPAPLRIPQTRTGPAVLPPDPEPDQSIQAPSTAAASEELSEHEVRWSWNAIGCFPGKAGSVPKPCAFVQSIEGFKVYAIEGGLRKAVVQPAARVASLGKPAGKCYVVTRVHGRDRIGAQSNGLRECADRSAVQDIVRDQDASQPAFDQRPGGVRGRDRRRRDGTDL